MSTNLERILHKDFPMNTLNINTPDGMQEVSVPAVASDPPTTPATQTAEIVKPRGRRKGAKSKRPSPLKGRKLGPRKPKPLVEYAVKVDSVLDERAKAYGTFNTLSGVSQELKRVVYKHLASRTKVLADDQTEAFDMICHKLARLINGDADHIDSWVDIAGYAQLVADRLQGRAR